MDLLATKEMKVLIACEYSGIVREAFKAKGHDAWSCDLLPTEIEGNHFQGNVFEIIDHGWDLMIAFPPCTHLAVSGAAWFEEKKKDGRQKKGIDFFLKLVNSLIPKIAIENPIGIISTVFKKPNQIIHPYYFGDPHSKATCLWLKNLPKLCHIKNGDMFEEKTHVDPVYIYAKSSGKRYSKLHWIGGGHGKERSLTFPGIAQAMAEQWG